ncbi:MAG: 30S ribosomal protein S21 [Bacteroidetes bacterium]|nr:30S ribosomal protein S21 [Bacteroidota bacterium]
MLIIPVKEGENVDKALKVYKKKFEKTGMIRALRERKQFTKQSVKRRQEILRAVYRQQITNDLDN